MGNTSDYKFVDGAEFQLNQLFGYQDAEEGRARELRVRDAFRRQHAWDDTSSPTWSDPWNLGDHVGVIGYQADPSQTQFYGDGSGITNIGANGGIKDLSQSFANPEFCIMADGSLVTGNRVTMYLNHLACWYKSTGIPSGVWYGHSTSSMINLGLAFTWPYSYSPSTIANQPTSSVVWLSGDFDLHLHYMVVAWSATSLVWGGGDQLLVRPQLYAQDQTVYTYPADDLAITTAGNGPDTSYKWFWHCHQVLHVSSFPAGFASIGWQIQGNWANTPHAICIFCMTRGQIAKINSWAPAQNAALLNKAQLGFACKSVSNPYGAYDYAAGGANSFNMFPIYAT